MKKVGLDKATSGLGWIVIVNQRGIFRLRSSEFVIILARLIDKEVGSVLSDQNSISGVIDSFIWNTVDHLQPSKKHKKKLNTCKNIYYRF